MPSVWLAVPTSKNTLVPLPARPAAAEMGGRGHFSRGPRRGCLPIYLVGGKQANQRNRRDVYSKRPRAAASSIPFITGAGRVFL